jgi:hypothetical protein
MKGTMAEHADAPRFSDDGLMLTPVDGRSELGNLAVTAIESPPFSRWRLRTTGERRRAETMVTANDASPAAPVVSTPDSEANALSTMD